MPSSRSPFTEPQKVSQVYLQREDISIQLSTVQAVLSPMSIHQNSETNVSHPQRKGCASDSLYRQPTNFGGVQRVDPRSRDRNAVPTRVSRIHCEHQEVSVNFGLGDKILGSDRGFNSHGNQASSNQNTNTSGS